MSKTRKLSKGQESLLGMDINITRRDFLNAILFGTGVMLLDLPSPLRIMAQTSSWQGYGGVGDYAESAGNTEEVIKVFTGIQQGKYKDVPADALDTGEVFDVAIIGGGLSGLGAAYEFRKKSKGKSCLILENHPVFGGQAKRNEFFVSGHRLIGPQASNAFVVIDRPGIAGYELFSELGIPDTYRYQSLEKNLKQLHFDRTNYGFALWHDISPNVGYFFENLLSEDRPGWIRDIWSRSLDGTPYQKKTKNDLMTWRNSRERYYAGTDLRTWLDSMTYKDYIEKVMELNQEITRFADPVLASGLGLGCDAISAYGAYQISMPGFQGFTRNERNRRLEESSWHSFPGGNDGFARYLLKAIIPDSIQGKFNFEHVITGRINFRALDQPDNAVRMRLGATVVRIEHESLPDSAEHVWITYRQAGKTYRLRARGIVMASGSWTNRYIVHDLPQKYQEAYRHFLYSSVLVANVALTNWRFLYKLGLTGCRWFSGFGYTCNIRQPMIVGDYKPPLHPDKPVILTFYVPLHYPGLPAKEQGEKGRATILSTTYYDYERQIREQMVRLFSGAGFNPRDDIAGIVLNRWVYAYLNPQPGFYFGVNGQKPPRDTIRNRFGRIAFGHSELDGHQNWSGAVTEGQRAARQIIGIL